ncbi:PAS domain S-box protein [Nocardioides sp. MAHUQ-72]|uniref:PAS domain S-box protein n=1 Tax=unclassified Nocardioides TaxID=2615069 RepID=UPI003612DF35
MSGEPTIDPADQLAALGQAVITTRLDGTILAWNPAAERLYGWTTEEAVGENIASLCVPDLALEVAEEIMDALRAGVPWSGGFPVRRKDGTLFTALVTDSGVYRSGELVAIIGVSTNLGTALQPLLERSTDAALVLRSDAVITYASPAVKQLFGWEENEVVGSSLVPLLHPDDRAALAVYLSDAVRQPGARPAHEVRVRRGDGWAWAEAALTNFLDDPYVRGVVCNLRRSLAHTEDESAEERVARMETALQSRLVVERATGFLAGRHGITQDAAYQRLVQHGRRHHQSLQDVSRRVLADELDPADPGESEGPS